MAASAHATGAHAAACGPLELEVMRHPAASVSQPAPGASTVAVGARVAAAGTGAAEEVFSGTGLSETGVSAWEEAGVAAGKGAGVTVGEGAEVFGTGPGGVSGVAAEEGT